MQPPRPLALQEGHVMLSRASQGLPKAQIRPRSRAAFLFAPLKTRSQFYQQDVIFFILFSLFLFHNCHNCNSLYCSILFIYVILYVCVLEMFRSACKI